MSAMSRGHDLLCSLRRDTVTYQIFSPVNGPRLPVSASEEGIHLSSPSSSSSSLPEKNKNVVPSPRAIDGELVKRLYIADGEMRQPWLDKNMTTQTASMVVMDHKIITKCPEAPIHWSAVNGENGNTLAYTMSETMVCSDAEPLAENIMNRGKKIDLLTVDVNCCKKGSVCHVKKEIKPSAQDNLFPNVPRKLGGFHWIRRWDTCLKRSHPLFGAFKGSMSNAVYKKSRADLTQLAAASKEKFGTFDLRYEKYYS